MARGKRLNDMSSEKIEENFLEEQPDIPMNEKIVVEKVPIPKMEEIIFINNRDPGCALQFHYKSKTHPLKQYTLYHGHKHELPVEVINHLEGTNENDPWSCHARKYTMQERPDGTKEPVASSYVSYFQCKSVRKAA